MQLQDKAYVIKICLLFFNYTTTMYDNTFFNTVLC